MPKSDWEEKLGRLVTNDETSASREFGKLVSGRIGSSGRTFHCAVDRIPATTSRSAIRSRLHYDKRDAEHENRIDELESEGGRSSVEMEEILVAACKAQTRKNGVAALTLKVELPAEMTARHRKEVAEAIEGWFEARECPVHWAIHSRNEKGAYQPHLHMTVTNRPVRPIKGGWSAVAAGTRGRRGYPAVINGSEEMSFFRRDVVAAAINDVARRRGVDLAADWHGGTLKETGIDRMAKKRVPMAAYKGRLTPRPDGPAWANVQIDQGNAEEVIAARRQWSRQQVEARQARAAEKAAAKEAKRLAKLAELGGVPKEDAVAPAMVSRPLEPLTDKQQQVLLEVHQRLGLEVPDLGTHEGRAAAWAVIKAEKAMRQGHGNPQAEAPRKAESRDWASMPLEQFLAISGVKVRKNPHRGIDFDVHLPGGVKVTVAARDEDGAKAAAHKKLMRDAQKLGAATGVPDKTSPISPVLPIVTPAIPVESPRAGMAAAAAAQRRIASMSEAELQRAVARTRAKYQSSPPQVEPPGAPGGATKAAPPLPPVTPPPAPGAPALDAQPAQEDDWMPRPRGRGR